MLIFLNTILLWGVNTCELRGDALFTNNVGKTMIGAFYTIVRMYSFNTFSKLSFVSYYKIE